jgi:NitT/TauT family transport system permease protein
MSSQMSTSSGSLISLTNSQKIRIAQWTIFVAIVLLIEYVARSGVMSTITLVPPTQMAETLIQLISSGEIINDIRQTAVATFIAFLAAVLIGIPLGWAIWRLDTLRRILDPYLIAYYALPVFVFYPLFIAIFGLNQIPIILIAFALSIIAIVINTANGFDQVRDVFSEVGRSLKLSRYQTFRYIYLPAAVPYIFTGLKLGFIYALIGVIASEFILANAGLGYLVAYNYNNFATSEMYAVMLLVVIIAITTNMILVRIEDHLYKRSVTQ